METKESNVAKETVYIEKHKSLYFFLKRVLDILFSLFSLIILSPLFLLVGFVIKYDGSKGVVFFQQERVGINGKTFRMYKFRSMYPESEKRLKKIKHLNEIEGHMFKMKEDPRVTPIGKFIRAYSIDELPQLLNVLKGDMSLIGPRPPLIREFEKYSEYDKKRLAIRPGITGLWQVSGRNSLSFDEMVALDLRYIREISFMYDVKIFFKTIVVVIKKENAY